MNLRKPRGSRFICHKTALFVDKAFFMIYYVYW